MCRIVCHPTERLDMTTQADTQNAAIVALENRVRDLTEGLNSIPEQEMWLHEARMNIERAETRIEEDKLAYVQITAALNQMRA